MKKLLSAVAVVLVTSAPALAQYYPPPPPYPPPYPTPDQADDAKCRSWGLVPGTRAYSDCRITLDRNRPPPPPYPNPPYPTPPYPNPPGPWGPGPGPGPGPMPVEISDKDAISYCEKAAIAAPAYPIVKLAAKVVLPGREKVAKLSFNVIKPGGKPGFWNVECRFRGGRMISFSGPK
ncbi:hypothetical protein [Ancylobacter sp. IITR112]|uniref:hypothetical protein n=1 Tax=Ancylobacter sp. IITR112 TaxID=3138073 RepID=UPI00352AB66B